MLGVCYYPEHWPESWWADDARRMRDMGIVYVRVAEFAWSRFEPTRGAFDFGWLDRAIETLGKAGLKVVMCTPTATPPKWLMDEAPEIAPIDVEGRPRGHGSRRHYTFSSRRYWEESRRIVEIVAGRYGQNPFVAGWQTDNEYGCHDTILSWGEEDRRAFGEWLRRRYQSPERLNEAWGNRFWSMDLTDFAAVGLPHLTVTEANPAARLDFWRFSSEQTLAYDRMQVEILRKASPGRFITHNFMGLFHEFDHWPFGEHLDLASWDSYPIGFTERFPFSAEEKLRWAEVSHPDMAAFHHDLYRGVGRGRFWVMEQQPGPVNWAPWNPVPKPGMVRLWTWQALAHGAECVSYFRWRQAPFAQEQFHAGLNLPDNSGLSPGGEEATEVGRELAQLGPLPEMQPANVALVFDYESAWMTRIQPQGQDFLYYELAYRWYEAVRRLGLNVDIVPPGAPLKAYMLVLVPCLMHVSDAAVQAFEGCEGVMVFGPRSGSKTRHQGIAEGLPPGGLKELLGIRIKEVSSLRPGLTKQVTGQIAGAAERWTEFVLANDGTEILSRFETGAPAITQRGSALYCGFWPATDALQSLIAHATQCAGLTVTNLPDGIRLTRRGNLTFAFNFGEDPWPVPTNLTIVLGSNPILPQGFSICRRHNMTRIK